MSTKSLISNTLIPAILIFLAIAIPAAPTFGAEALVNPSFEEVEPSGQAAGWDQTSYKTESGASEFSISDGQAHSGKKSAKIINYSENDSRFIQNFKIRANTNYKISCWIMASGIGEQGAGAVLSIGNQLDTTRKISDTNGEWQYAEMYVKVGTGRHDINITVGIGGYSSLCTGTAFFDDVAVEVVEDIPQGATVAIIGDFNDTADSDGTTPSANEDKPQVQNKNALYLACLIIISLLLTGAALYLLKKNRNSHSGANAPTQEQESEEETESYKNNFFDDDIE